MDTYIRFNRIAFCVYLGMKKINWKYVLAILAFLILGSLLLAYKIGDQYLWTDEVFSFHAAKMIIEKGIPLYDSGLDYSRASIYHNILAWSMRIFGVDTFGSRIINIPFILGTGLVSFFFTRDILQKKKNAFWMALITASIYITTNFSIALARETRMYPLLVFCITLSAYAFYKTIIKPKRFTNIKIKKLDFKFNIPWAIVFLASFYIAYETHPIALIFGVGILTYFVLSLIINKKRESFIYILLVIIAGFTISYFKYNSLNIYDIFINLSPDWAINPPIIIFYSFLLVQTLPSIFLFSTIILISIFKYHKETDLFLFSFFGSYLAFISFQRAQPERYLQPIIPILIILFVISIYRYFEHLPKDKTKKLLLLFIVLITSSSHIYLLQKELQEIDTYTPTSISIHKKMKFEPVFEYLNNKDLNNYLMIADYHTSFTLHEMGYSIDYILVNETSIEILKGNTEEHYFNMPYLIYEQDFEEIVKNKSRIIILRHEEDFPNIDDSVVQLEEFIQPTVYR